MRSFSVQSLEQSRAAHTFIHFMFILLQSVSGDLRTTTLLSIVFFLLPNRILPVHTAAMLTVCEHAGAHVACPDYACVEVSFTYVDLLASVRSEYCYGDRLLTGHTERNTVVMQLSYRLPGSHHNIHAVLMSGLGRDCATGTHRFAPADGKPQQWSLWRPAFPLISWLMYREKPGPLESHWIPARLPNLPPHQSYVMFWSAQ